MEEILEIIGNFIQTAWQIIHLSIFGDYGGIGVILDIAIILIIGLVIIKIITGLDANIEPTAESPRHKNKTAKKNRQYVKATKQKKIKVEVKSKKENSKGN